MKETLSTTVNTKIAIHSSDRWLSHRLAPITRTNTGTFDNVTPVAPSWTRPAPVRANRQQGQVFLALVPAIAASAVACYVILSVFPAVAQALAILA